MALSLTFSASAGNGMRMILLFRKPPSTPVTATAFFAPVFKASFNPLITSSLVNGVDVADGNPLMIPSSCAGSQAVKKERMKEKKQVIKIEFLIFIWLII